MNKLIGKAQYYAGHETDLPIHLEQGSLWVAMDTGKLFLYDRFRNPHQIMGSGWDQSPLTPEEKETLSHFRYDEDSNKLVADVSIETLLSSLYLGQAWKLSSAGDTVCFVTEELNDAVFPVGFTFYDHENPANQGAAGFERARTVECGDLVETEIYGPPAAMGVSTTYTTSGITGLDVFIFSIEVIVEEVITPGDEILYQFFGGANQSFPLIYEQRFRGLSLNPGDTLHMNFSNPLLQVAGSVVSSRLVFVQEGEVAAASNRLVSVRASLGDSNQHWAAAQLRFFNYATLATEQFVNDTVDNSVLGKMDESIYDPDGRRTDVFDMDNMVESASLKIMTNDERNQIEDNRLDNITQDTAIALNTAKETYPPADQSKLAGIETGAEVNQTDAEIRAQVDSAIDSNVYTDLEKTIVANAGGNLNAHINDIGNPHSVTKAQIGLDQADNTSDVNKPISTATQVALDSKVDDAQVLTNVPAGAVFTDTVYDDTSIQAEVDLNTAKVTNVDHPLVETAVPVGAVFTDTIYDDTSIQAEVDLNTAKVTNVDHPLVETAVPVGAVFTDTVYDDTVIQGEVDLNTAKVSYPGPQDISGKADKTNVLELDNTDVFTPDADYEPATKKYVDDNPGYLLATWGANIQTVGRHPAINSPSNAAEVASLGIMASMPVPATGTIDTIAYYNTTADNTTTFQIIKNGQVMHTFTCTGPYGAETGINVPIGFAGSVPDNIAIRYLSGTAPGPGLYSMYIK